MRSKKLPAALLTLAAFAATSCATSSPKTSVSDLTVVGNIQTLEIAPVLIASERIYRPAFVVRRGNIANLSPEDPATKADLATNAETQALRFSIRHPDLRILMTVAEGHYRILARRSAGIAQLSDLAGKKVATYAPTSSGYFLHKMLQSAGLSYDDVSIVPIGDLSKVPELMANRDADAVAIWEPYSANAEAVLGEDAIAFDGDGIYRELFNLNTTASSLADPAKRAQIVEYVRAIIIATRMVEANPELGWQAVAKSGGFDVGEVARAWEHHSYPATLAPDLLDVMVEEEIWLAKAEMREPRSREQLEALLDRSILAEALTGL